MFYKLIVGGLLLSLIGCQQIHDDKYYMAHPNVLFMDFQHCKAKQQTNSSCKHLEKLARILQATVMSLKEDPLAFGQEVIKLEEHCANIVTNQHEDKLCHENLPEKLAVIRWLESPENKI